MKEATVFKNIELPKAPARKIELNDGVQKDVFLEITEGGAQDIELTVGRNSTVEVVCLQNLNEDQEVQVNLTIRAASDSLVKVVVIQNGSKRGQFNVLTPNPGKGSSVRVFGLQHAKNGQKLEFRADAKHATPHTFSDLQVWCVARDDAHSIFNGLITIDEGAHHTEAFQKNKNLLLSPKATVDTFPKLFIFNDEVKCAHGSSTSTLEPDQLVYLESRGIPRAQAESMILSGFLNQALEQITDTPVRERVRKDLRLEREEVWGEA